MGLDVGDAVGFDVDGSTEGAWVGAMVEGEDDGGAASALRSSEESVEESRRGFARDAIISYIRTLRGS